MNTFKKVKKFRYKLKYLWNCFQCVLSIDLLKCKCKYIFLSLNHIHIFTHII